MAAEKKHTQKRRKKRSESVGSLFKRLCYSHSNMIAAVMIALLFVAITALNIAFSNREKEVVIDEHATQFGAEMIAYEEALIEAEEEQNLAHHPTYPKYEAPQLLDIEFDPNVADSALLSSVLGKTSAKMILKYRSHGGAFYNIEDIKKVYYVDTARIEQVAALIHFDAAPQREILEKKSYFNFELNSISDSLLATLPNIGQGRAAAIVAYRKRLGGFVDISQLNEIAALNEQIIDSISPYITINIKVVKQLKINSLSVEKLRQHPYINFFQAKEIVQTRYERNRNGAITKEDFLKLEQFTQKEKSRLLPYLDFSINK